MAMTKLPGKEIALRYVLGRGEEQDGERDGELEIKLFVDMNVGIGGDIWPAAQWFCQWMLLNAYRSFFSDLFNGKRVLELGSGNALVSVLVEKAFQPAIVVATDLESHVPHICHNLEMNGCVVSRGASLDWLNDHDTLDSAPFDVILALECLYREELYEPLIKTMLRLSHPRSLFFLGVTRAFVKPTFFTLLTKHGFRYRKVPANMLTPHMSYEASTGMFIAQRI